MTTAKQISKIKSKLSSGGGDSKPSSGGDSRESIDKLPSKRVETSTSSWGKLVDSYRENTAPLVKFIDSFLLFCVLTGVIQFLYMLVMGTYPYNAFLAGFAVSCGMFCNVANLRIQVGLKDSDQGYVSTERAYADFAFSSMVLFFFAVCFVG